jgi:hypothetical protein
MSRQGKSKGEGEKGIKKHRKKYRKEFSVDGKKRVRKEEGQ